jgi:WD40 repeat protein
VDETVIVNASGARITAGRFDRTVKMRAAQTSQQTSPLGGTDAVLSVCFSPDGKRLASGKEDRPAKVWDTSLRKPLEKP